MLDSNQPDLEVALVELEDDAVIVVSLRVADPAQIEGRALWVSSATAASGLGAQHRFDMGRKGRELAILLRELAEARLELARRDTAEAFARAPSPRARLH